MTITQVCLGVLPRAHLLLIIAAVCLSGCNNDSRWNRQHAVIPDPVKHYPVLAGNDPAFVLHFDSRQGPDADPGPAPFPLGNGHIAAVVGMERPLGALTAITGPTYGPPRDDCTPVAPALVHNDTALAPVIQSVARVPRSGIVRTTHTTASGLTLTTYDYCHPGVSAIMRLLIVDNTTGAPQEALAPALSYPRHGVAKEDGTVVIGEGPLLMMGAIGGKTRVIAPESEHNALLACPIGTLAPDEKVGVLFYMIAADTAADAAQTRSIIEHVGLDGLTETAAQVEKWHEKGLQIHVSSADITDLLEVQKEHIRTQIAASGVLADLSSGHGQADVCAATPAVRFLLAGGYFDEVQAHLEYLVRVAVAGGVIAARYPAALAVNDTTLPEETWQPTAVAARPAAHLIIQHLWYYRHTGDLELVKRHWPLLQACLVESTATEGEIPPLTADDAEVILASKLLAAGIEPLGYAGPDSLAAASAISLAVAAEAMADMARALGRDDEGRRYAQRAKRLRQAIERTFRTGEPPLYGSFASQLGDSRVGGPLGAVAFLPLWLNYADSADDRQREALDAALAYLWQPGKALKCAPDIPLARPVEMAQALRVLAMNDDPREGLVAARLVDAAAASGAYFNIHRTDGRPAGQVCSSGWGIEAAGAVGEALLYCYLRYETDIPAQKQQLMPRPGTARTLLQAQNIPLGPGEVLDLSIGSGVQSRLYSITHRGEKTSPNLDLTFEVPGEDIVAVDGEYAVFGGKKGAVRRVGEFSRMTIAGLELPQEAVMELQITYGNPFVDPSASSGHTCTSGCGHHSHHGHGHSGDIRVDARSFYHEAPPLPRSTRVAVLTADAEYAQAWQKEAGRQVAILDLNLFLPSYLLGQLLFDTDGNRIVDEVVTDFQEDGGLWARPAYWSSGTMAQVLRQFTSRGGRISEAKNRTPGIEPDL